MGFDKDAELDQRLETVGAIALLAHYREQFLGFKLCKKMKTSSQDEDLKKLVPRIDKAIKATFADLEALASAVDGEAVAEASDDEEPPEAPDDEEVAEEADAPEDSALEGVDNDTTLRSLYWRIHDGWSAASPERRGDAASAIKMIAVNGGTPSWTDLATLMGELAEIDRDSSEGGSFPSAWFQSLVDRFETKLGKKKKKKSSSKSEPVIRTPPPDATILDYSAKATFREGDWVSHPKFGTGIVVEAGPNVLIEFGPEQKRLAHVPPTAPPSAMPRMKTKTTADTLELARAAGIEIKKIPARVEDEEK